MDNRSPSWSWSSIGSSVCFYSSSEMTRGSIISVECETVGEDAFGEVKSGKIVLEVDLVRAQPVPATFLSPRQQASRKNGTLPPVGVALKGKAFKVDWDTNESDGWSFADSLDDPVGEGTPAKFTSIETHHKLSGETSRPMLYAFHIASHSSLVFDYYIILICENEKENLLRRVGFMMHNANDESADILASPKRGRFPLPEAVLDKSGGKSTIITLI